MNLSRKRKRLNGYGGGSVTAGLEGVRTQSTQGCPLVMFDNRTVIETKAVKTVFAVGLRFSRVLYIVHMVIHNGAVRGHTSLTTDCLEGQSRDGFQTTTTTRQLLTDHSC